MEKPKGPALSNPYSSTRIYWVAQFPFQVLQKKTRATIWYKHLSLAEANAGQKKYLHIKMNYDNSLNTPRDDRSIQAVDPVL